MPGHTTLRRGVRWSASGARYASNVLHHMGELSSLHDVQVRLLAWLGQYYDVTAHSSLMSKTPASVFASGRRSPVSEVMLREALIVRGKRQLRRDTTLWIAGSEFETTQSFLTGRNVTVGRSLLDCSELPWFEHEDQGYVVTHVAPRTNVDLACVAVSMRLPSIRRAFCSRKPSARRPNGGAMSTVAIALRP